ncbi:MAG TPA: 30S ribosomal protein S3 [Hyphomonas adhaerens]|uniref:Small ribosomal subunit protein uS3 n=1 Tax=Hyphomonas adhaerens TaxID=81029 RepID=A0A3B9GTC8_9PROT|nr:30S ribosomal protein S3 [Hyphomonas adhaerens]
MGQKVHPVGIRLGIVKEHTSVWYADYRNYADYLNTDLKVRAYIQDKLKSASVSRVDIQRPAQTARITIHTARPGIVIGKKGEDVEKLRQELTSQMGVPVHINIEEIRKPELDGALVAQSVAQQLERRVMFRRAMKRAVQNAMRIGAKGIKIQVSGRLGGAEIARTEKYAEGSVPLHTLRADIDYGTAEAETTYGIIGIKVWVYKGEILEHDPMAQDKRLESSGQSRARANANQRGPATGAQTAGA